MERPVVADCAFDGIDAALAGARRQGQGSREALRVPVPEAAVAIVSTLPECRDTASPWTIDLLEKLEPDVKQSGAPPRRFLLFPGMVRPSSHAGQNSPMMVRDWLPRPKKPPLG